MAVSRPVQPKRKVTMAEIAQVARVSQSVVSFVLNHKSGVIRMSDATRQRVLEVARDLDYKPNAAARALRAGRSHTILMVAFDVWDQRLIERLHGVEAHLNPLGYSIRFCTVASEGGLASYTEILGSGQADGVLLTGLATTDTYSLLRNLHKEADEAGVPVVALTNGFPRDMVEMVADIQDEQGAEDAVTHLIGHGHKRILFVGVSDQPWAESRERGYRLALKKAGISIDPELIITGAIDGRRQKWAYETTRQLIHSLDFTAVFAIGDDLAVAVISALKDEGRRVPKDCAVIGFNNDENMACFTDPPLTTVDNPFYEIGKAAAEMLVNLIEGRSAENVSLPVSLVIRNSCGC